MIYDDLSRLFVHDFPRLRDIKDLNNTPWFAYNSEHYYRNLMNRNPQGSHNYQKQKSKG